MMKTLCYLLHRFWLDLGPEDVHWTISDTGWAKCAYGCFFAPWSQGACVFVSHEPKFEVRGILETLSKYPISTLCSPPTAYRMMVQEDLRQYKFPKLRHCVSAGEPLNPEVMAEWKEGTGYEIREGYGQTETVSACDFFVLCLLSFVSCNFHLGPSKRKKIHQIN